MSCTQDGVEWVAVVGRAAKGGSWVMWRFTGVSSGGRRRGIWADGSSMEAEEGERGGRKGKRQQQQQQHSRRKIDACELWCTSLRREKRGSERERGGKKERQNFRRQGDEIRFYLPPGLPGYPRWGWQSNCPVDYCVQYCTSGIMNKLTSF